MLGTMSRTWIWIRIGYEDDDSHIYRFHSHCSLYEHARLYAPVALSVDLHHPTCPTGSLSAVHIVLFVRLPCLSGSSLPSWRTRPFNHHLQYLPKPLSLHIISIIFPLLTCRFSKSQSHHHRSPQTSQFIQSPPNQRRDLRDV